MTIPDLRRRRLFLIGNLVFLLCLVVGVILVFVVSSTAGKFVVAACLVVIMTTNIVLRLTYFKDVLPEIRREREGRTAERS